MGSQRTADTSATWSPEPSRKRWMTTRKTLMTSPYETSASDSTPSTSNSKGFTRLMNPTTLKDSSCSKKSRPRNETSAVTTPETPPTSLSLLKKVITANSTNLAVIGLKNIVV